MSNIADFWKENREYAGRKQSDIIIKLVGKHIGKEVLDMGAGDNSLIEKLGRGIGIDIAPKNKNILKMHSSRLKFKDNTFDTVFACELLEHLSETELRKTIKEAHRVLKPGGRFIIVSPFNEDLERAMVKCPKCGNLFHRWLHERTFDLSSAHTIAGNMFRVVKQLVYPLGFVSWHRRLPFSREIGNLLKKKQSLIIILSKK